MAFIYFILLLGGLIFFHELGHFLAARAMGVQVQTFSIGFGPTLFSFNGRKREGLEPTEYVIALLPMGGYVKMLGDDPSEELEPGRLETSFSQKKIWQRLLIVCAGPAFNLILPYIIYMGMGLILVDRVPSWIGMVDPVGAASSAGLKAGDRVISIDGESITSWWQLRDLVSEHPTTSLEMVVEREGLSEPLALELTPTLVREELLPGIGIFNESGRIGVSPVFLRPFVMVREGSVAIEGKKILDYDALLTALGAAKGARVSMTVERSRLPDSPTLLGAAEQEELRVMVSPDERDAWRGLGSWDCLIREVDEGSPADTLGLKPGDVVLALDEHPCRHWGFLAAALADDPDATHTITWASQGVLSSAERRGWLDVVVRPIPGDADHQVRTFGVITELGRFAPPPIEIEGERWAYATRSSIRRTHEAVRLNLAAITGLFSGNVPLDELSGPIGIAHLAAKTVDYGWEYFFGLMVWLSVSLGLINLLPIPILDGGHVLFLAMEAVRRQPVSLRTRQLATYMGLAFIVVLMMFAIKNDIERPW
jgi:regulator of sigma E protease